MKSAKRSSALTVMVFSIGMGELGAQTPTVPLTVSEAVEHALESYPGIQAARFGAEGAASMAGGAAAERWPTVALSTSAVRYQEPMPVTPIHGFTPGLIPSFDRGLFQGGTSLRYTVFDGFGRGARIDAAQEEAEAAALNVTGTAQALVARVTATYLGILGSSRVLEAQDRRLAALEAEHSRARQLLDVGRAADVDLLRVEAALAAAQADRVSLAAGVDLGEQELSRLTGIPVARTRAAGLTPVQLDGSTLPARETLLEQAYSANPAVLTARRRLAAGDARVSAARSNRWPKLDLAANYMAWASAADRPTTEWNLGVSVSVPVFSGGAVTRHIDAADAERSTARERLRLRESDVSRDLDQALSAVAEARARVSSLVTAVARSAEVARIEQLRLDTGSGVQRDYLDAEAVLFSNRAALVQARNAEILARVTVAQITGELDVNWLTNTLGDTP